MQLPIVVLGLQYGDEGKGKLVDYLSKDVDAVIRFNGGAGAGHTVVLEDKKYVFHLLPSCALHQNKLSILGAGMVVDPWALEEELSKVSIINLVIAAETGIVMPYHKSVDKARETLASKIGTTGQGIGPAYEDLAARRGIRFADFANVDTLRSQLVKSLTFANRELGWFEEPGYIFQEQFDRLLDIRSKFLKYITPLRVVVKNLLMDGKTLLYEGAQGALLDRDLGTFPFVTSSTTIPAGVYTGGGLPIGRETDPIGVFKAYCTRVGKGPFPTEEERDVGALLRKKGNEFGSTTGRPRRCGWLDLPALRYAIRTTGTKELTMTKLDVLSGI